MAKISELVKNVEEKVEEKVEDLKIPEKEVEHTVFGKLDQKILDRRDKRAEKKAKKADAKAAKKAEKGETLSVGKRIAIGAAAVATVAAATGAIVYKTMANEAVPVEALPEGCDGSEPCDCETSDVSTVAEGET